MTSRPGVGAVKAKESAFATPSNLPAQAPSKFELVFNLNTAKALGLSVRSSFLQLADEVIE